MGKAEHLGDSSQLAVNRTISVTLALHGGDEGIDAIRGEIAIRSVQAKMIKHCLAVDFD
jgi:hypothetical protein